MSSPDETDRGALARALLAVARDSIEYGFRFGLPHVLDPRDFPAALRKTRASFVTLRADGVLRGCVGSVEAHRALVADVAHNAFAAANRDPRFPPLEPGERARIELHVAILSPSEPIRFRSEAELLGALEPGVHGLWVSVGAKKATFLPQVWAQLPERREFLWRLLEKAGIAPGLSCEALHAARYTVEEISGPLAVSGPAMAASG